MTPEEQQAALQRYTAAVQARATTRGALAAAQIQIATAKAADDKAATEETAAYEALNPSPPAPPPKPSLWRRVTGAVFSTSALKVVWNVALAGGIALALAGKGCPGPGPTPVPPVPPGPVPPGPTPVPVPVKGLRVLMVTGKEPMDAAQTEALYDNDVQAYLNEKCPLGPDGKTHEWRIWPSGLSAESEAPEWQNLYKRPMASTPWIVIASDTSIVFEGPLPKDAADLLALLKKYGG